MIFVTSATHKTKSMFFFLVQVRFYQCYCIEYMIYKNKRYFKINQHFGSDVECLSSPPPLLCSEIITPFNNYFNQSGKKFGILANCETLIPLCSSVEFFLQKRIFFSFFPSIIVYQRLIISSISWSFELYIVDSDLVWRII